MYWSAYKFPSLAGRPRAEQKAILDGALREFAQAYRRRFLIFFIADALACYLLFRLYPGYPMSDWRFWIAPALGSLLGGAYILWEVNGTVHEAVKKYIASRNP